MSPKKEITALFIIDLCFLTATALIISQMIQPRVSSASSTEALAYVNVGVIAFWLLFFVLAGLYRSWYRTSVFDEIVLIFNTVSLGMVFIILLTTVEVIRVNPVTPTKLILVVYWFLLICMVSLGRFSVRTFQRRLLLSGIGRRRTIIVGWNEKAFELRKKIARYPALGYDIVGFVRIREQEASLVPLEAEHAAKLGSGGGTYKMIQDDIQADQDMDLAGAFSGTQDDLLGFKTNLPHLIENENVSEVLIALDSREHDELISIMDLCQDCKVNMKIIPDLYDIVSGQARTTQIYGVPLIEIEPDLMPMWEHHVKRILDVVMSVVGLVLSFPICVLTAIAIKLDSRGPVIYKQLRSGQNGRQFYIRKFRTMEDDAEQMTGPVWAAKQDPRVTRIGSFLRRARIDEIPQLINIFIGTMSFVGPRPERPVFVDQFKHEIPLYAHRLRVKPGLTGWAQVKHKYDESIEDVKQKLQYDLFYIENMSLKMDLKIILLTIYVVLKGKGQ